MDLAELELDARFLLAQLQDKQHISLPDIPKDKQARLDILKKACLFDQLESEMFDARKEQVKALGFKPIGANQIMLALMGELHTTTEKVKGWFNYDYFFDHKSDLVKENYWGCDNAVAYVCKRRTGRLAVRKQEIWRVTEVYDLRTLQGVPIEVANLLVKLRAGHVFNDYKVHRASNGQFLLTGDVDEIQPDEENDRLHARTSATYYIAKWASWQPCM